MHEASQLSDHLASAQEENAQLRILLALTYAYRNITSLYLDDGEVQDNSLHPSIDFKRDSVDVLREKMRSRSSPTMKMVSEPGSQEATQVYGIFDPDYARIFTIARCLAWNEGYALCAHGSFTRDLDLIAVPWEPTACEPEHLMKRIEEGANLKCITPNPGGKNHGRLAWTMVMKKFADPRFVDFSVIPPRKD